MDFEPMGDKDAAGKAEETVVKTLEETDKKCDACGGTMDFDPKTGMLVCPYCGSMEEIENENERAEELSFYEAEERGNCDWGTEKKTVICKNCGAETVYDSLETAGECPYCGSNQVMEAAEEDTLAPGGICPFRVDRPGADQLFRNWLKRRWFCPGAVKKNAGRVEFKGVYLPYWTFDTTTDSLYSARYGIVRTVVVGSGKNRRTRTYVDWYRTHGSYNEFFNDRLVKGSTRHNLSLLTQIEPFNTENNLAYRPEYLSGFAAERYSVGLDDAWGTAKRSIEVSLNQNVEREILRRHHADRVDSLKIKTVYHNITYKYLMLPVWMSHFSYNGKTYPFMINGQTGKVGGKAPLSPLRIFLAVLGGVGFVFLLYLLFYFLGGL